MGADAAARIQHGAAADLHMIREHCSEFLKSGLDITVRGVHPHRLFVRTHIRRKARRTPEAPRLVLHRSSRHMHVQVIDDLAGHTLVSASSMEADVRALEGDKKAKAAKVGELVAERAKAAVRS